MSHDSASLPGDSALSKWSRTTTGIVVTLILVQFLTGTFLTFYYVPSVDHAHATVSFIERALSSGSWLRALHHYGSQWLSLFAFLHVVRLYWQETYQTCRGRWLTSVLLLALVMANGATGYSLPWDARAFFSTRVAEGLMGGLPFAGQMARLWLLGGNEISTLTLSRFFALHVLVVPALIIAVLVCRQLFPNVDWPRFYRNAVAGGLVFAALALWALKNPAPLGPPVSEAGADYLPRPGAQFLWLYQTLKYVPGGLGSIVGVILPGVGVLLLASLPWLKTALKKLIGGAVLAVVASLVVSMSIAAYLKDHLDQKAREQLARQAAEERLVRSQPYQPTRLNGDVPATSNDSPPAYIRFCANCHGPRGEGARQGQFKFPPLIGVGEKPRRSVEDIIGLLNDPTAYGLEPPMRSFATKLTEQEKRDIAEWLVKLK